MLQQIKKTIAKYKMFKPLEKVVVAVSGGPDSVALLHVLKHINISLCLNICVAHFDHNLRKYSLVDCRFVEKLSKSLNIPFYSGRLNWAKVKKQGSVEDLLRKHRYDFLFSICKKTGAKKIALGHTKDDQAETVLMRILRGSGLYGLSAILPVRAVDGFKIVRPLVEVSRAQIMDYLKKDNLSFRIDSTNFEDRFMRNRVRNNLLPLLEKQYNPNIKETLSILALSVGADYDYLQSKAEEFLKCNAILNKGIFRIKLKALNNLGISLKRLALRKAVESSNGDLRGISFSHWQEAENLLDFRPAGSEAHFPDGLIIKKNKNYLIIFKR